MTDWRIRHPDAGHAIAARDRGFAVCLAEQGYRADRLAEWWVRTPDENTTLAWGTAATMEQAMEAADDAAGGME